MKPDVKAIIFDCFGVLMEDSLDLAFEHVVGQDNEKRKAIGDLVKAANRGFITGQEARDQMAEILGISKAEWSAAIDSFEGKNQRLFEYVLELRQSYKTAMLSNISSTGLDRRFRPGELDEYFDVVVASGSYGMAKPDPEIYMLTAEKLMVPSKACVFIDDRVDFCEGARAVGMEAVEYTGYESLRSILDKMLAANTDN